jgi:glycine cleavage system H protein
LGVQRKYAETYEYIMIDKDTGIVGISREASDKLGDIYLVDLPQTGKEVKKGDEVGVIESVKAASDVFTPVSGKIIEVNNMLGEKPELISEDPLGEGWIFKIEIKDKKELDGLMTHDEFKKFVNEAN